jgi:hypothetical protein
MSKHIIEKRILSDLSVARLTLLCVDHLYRQCLNTAILFALFLAIALFATEAGAVSITLDFENLSDSTVIGSSYALNGVTLSGGVIATAGISLNDFDFPPNSGTSVAIDATGPINLSFTTPISSFLGYFTYAEPLTVTAFDSANQTVATATSLLSSNFVSSGNAPNELVQLSFAGGIDHLTISGNPNGLSFVVDDITFNTVDTVPPAVVPEPGTLLLIGTGVVGLFSYRRFLVPFGKRS